MVAMLLSCGDIVRGARYCYIFVFVIYAIFYCFCVFMCNILSTDYFVSQFCCFAA